MSIVWLPAGPATVAGGLGPLPLAVKAAVSALLSVGVVYFCLILSTFTRYGETLDKTWTTRLNNIVNPRQPNLGYGGPTVHVPSPQPPVVILSQPPPSTAGSSTSSRRSSQKRYRRRHGRHVKRSKATSYSRRRRRVNDDTSSGSRTRSTSPSSFGDDARLAVADTRSSRNVQREESFLADDESAAPSTRDEQTEESIPRGPRHVTFTEDERYNTTRRKRRRDRTIPSQPALVRGAHLCPKHTPNSVF